MYGNVQRKIITDSPEAWSLAGVAKRLSFAIDNMNLPIANLVVDTPGGGNVNVFRHGSMEIWNLKSGSEMHSMYLIDNNEQNIYTLGKISGYNSKYRGVIKKMYAMPRLPDIIYGSDKIKPPYFFSLTYTVDPDTHLPVYSISANNLSNGVLLAGPTLLSYTGSFFRWTVIPNGIIVVSWTKVEAANQTREWLETAEWGEWEADSGLMHTESTQTYFTRYRLVNNSGTYSFVKDDEVALPVSDQTYPAQHTEGYAYTGVPAFIAAGEKRFVIGLNGREDVTILTTSATPLQPAMQWWPKSAHTYYNPSIYAPFSYAYDLETLSLIDELTGNECDTGVYRLEVAPFYRERTTTAGALNDELWDVRGIFEDPYRPNRLEVQRYSLATGVKTVAFTVNDEWWLSYSDLAFIIDKKGLLIQHVTLGYPAATLDQFHRFKFDDADDTGAVRDETGDIILIQYDAGTIPPVNPLPALPDQFKGQGYITGAGKVTSYPW